MAKKKASKKTKKVSAPKTKTLWFGGSLKNFGNCEVALFKLAVFAFALFLVNVWPAFQSWVLSVHWGWFLGVSVIASLSLWPKLFN